jgi:hypothetical protein
MTTLTLMRQGSGMSDAHRGRPGSRLGRTRLLGLLAAACATALVTGCAGASAPENVVGVRALYRSIGIDASSGDFTDICRTYMTGGLREELVTLHKPCSPGSAVERWAEKVRVAKVGTARIALSGTRALVRDGSGREVALYENGQWRLDEVPEIAP